MKRILIFIGLLNVFEAVHVWIKKIPASFLKLPIDPITHSVFHLIVGLFLIYFCSKPSFLTNKYAKLGAGVLSLFFMAYSMVIIATRQAAVKFGYPIIYPLHAAYYFLVGLLLLSIFSSLNKKQTLRKE